MVDARRTSSARCPARNFHVKNPKPCSMQAPETLQQRRNHLPHLLPLLHQRPSFRAFHITSIFLALGLVLLGGTRANADEQSAATAQPTNQSSTRRIEVRLSISRAAADALSETRIRRLFE